MDYSVQYCLLADRVLTEEGSKKHSIIGLFDSVHRSSPLPLLPTCALFMLLDGPPGKAEVTVSVKAFDTDEPGPGLNMGDLGVEIETKGQDKANIVINFNGLPIPGNRIEFEVYINKVLIYTKVLKVIDNPESKRGREK